MSYAIVDIDGTVALHVLPGGQMLRGHHEYNLVGADAPNPPIIRLVKALDADGVDIEFVSGRPEHCRAETEAWLWREMRLRCPLTMRASGDYRADDTIKSELYHDHVLPRRGEEPMLVLDDRPRVIRMWASLGFTVLDVAPMSGEF